MRGASSSDARLRDPCRDPACVSTGQYSATREQQHSSISLLQRHYSRRTRWPLRWSTVTPILGSARVFLMRFSARVLACFRRQSTRFASDTFGVFGSYATRNGSSEA
eukprot:3838083-Rhodomonas_salina.1